MALDPTANETYIRESIKKYLVDELVTARALELTFDASLSEPNLADVTTGMWVAAHFGPLHRIGLADLDLALYCCTRGDNEGINLAALSDSVFDVMTDATQPDGKRRITLYNPNNWTALGSLLVQEVSESAQMDAPDETKFKIHSCRIRWVAVA
jgi:hypothetical protein